MELVEHLKKTKQREHVIISEKYKWIYLKFPRTAGTSLLRGTLEKNCNYSKHIFYYSSNIMVRKKFLSWINNIKNEHLKEYFIFTIVRNPYDRLVSAWRYIYLFARKENISFDNFVKNKMISKMYTSEASGHWSLMSDLVECDNRLITNYIGKYEDLDNSCKEICKNINFKIKKLPVINKLEHEHYSKYYTPELRQIVENVYRKDIELFNYSFEEI